MLILLAVLSAEVKGDVNMYTVACYENRPLECPYNETSTEPGPVICFEDDGTTTEHSPDGWVDEYWCNGDGPRRCNQKPQGCPVYGEPATFLCCKEKCGDDCFCPVCVAM